ncbi:Tether containing UBX domain for GLUT4 [Galemys pyrenaicus]|uniref:Tether containing UBX domain for GLUT4 n=1 Tax=Galemys pyrenaicus TaxID=202257 RepID=A0A8J5ZPF2_GALPY|nr:Tether containing UBX domain for GLUT4 [Galemys pyrenaicus]
MAAPAGGGGSAVSVLAPNGRRHTVKVTPSTVLLQVLEDTCRRQDFNPSEYDLKFQRSVLDLSVQWRFAGLPNHAKLEMVPAVRSRQRPTSTVRVALQLEDGPRLQGTFCPGQTLWELLSHFAQTRERLEQPSGASPVCVYMRDEVAGREALQGTTLQSLGLTGGSAIIRFAMKQGDSAGKQEPGIPRSRAPGSPTPSLSAEQAVGSPLLPLDTAGLSRGDVSREEAPGPSGSSPVQGPGPEPAGVQAAQAHATPAACVPFSGGGRRLGGPSAPMRPPAPTASRPAASPKPSSSPGGPSQPKKPKPGPEPRELQPPVEREPVVCHPDREEPLRAWPAELPDEFFEVTVDDVRRRLAQLKSERERLEEAPLVTKTLREAQEKEKLQRYPKVRALGRVAAGRRPGCRSLAEAAWGSRAEAAWWAWSPHVRLVLAQVALRVQFPDRYVLQGFFCPNETVGDLRDFVRSHLGNPDLPFYLFVAPPKTLLDDHTLTLFQANLFPAALVHFGAEPPTGGWGCGLGGGSGVVLAALASITVSAWAGAPASAGPYLEPGLLERTVSPSMADVLVARCMSRAAQTPPLPPAPAATPPEPEPAAEEGATGLPEPHPGQAQPLRRDTGKVPKWLKLPGMGGGGLGGCGRQPRPEVPCACSQQEVRAADRPLPTHALE